MEMDEANNKHCCAVLRQGQLQEHREVRRVPQLPEAAPEESLPEPQNPPRR